MYPIKEKFNCALLVDDDPVSNYINQVVISDYKRIGHTHDVLNGAEALDFINSKCEEDDFEPMCPDVILLDLNMPVMDGFEFLQDFQKLSFKKKDRVKIIVLTSSTNPGDIERASEYKVSGYINKPLTLSSLEAALQNR